MSYHHVVDLIGHTPIITLDRCFPDRGLRVYAKLEGFNPGGSSKDRTVLGVLRDAEDRGVIRPGDTLVEPVGGNSGVSLAMLAGPLGYHLVAVTPEDTSPAYVATMRQFGARVVHTPASDGMAGAEERAEELSRSRNCRVLSHFSSPAARQTHRRTTAREILLSLGVQPDYFLAGVGSGATFSGVGSVLREQIPGVCLVAVESARRGDGRAHPLFGPDCHRDPALLDRSLVDRVIAVDEEAAHRAARHLARREGLLAGPSSGAVLAAVGQLAEEVGERRSRRRTALIILADSGPSLEVPRAE